MNPAPAERVLVRGVNWLGDAIMTTPALMRLREARPHASITLLTPAKLADLWQHHPAVDEVLLIPAGAGLMTAAKRIREGNYTLAVVLPNSPRSALEVLLAGVPARIGLARRWRSWALTQAVPSQPISTRRRTAGEVQTLVREHPGKPRDQYPADAHHLLEYLEVVKAAGADATPMAPILKVDPTEVTAIRKRFNAPAGRPLCGLNAGAEYGPAKRWPEERFIEAARLLTGRGNCHWWVFGGAGDVGVAERIAAALPAGAAQTLAGKTSLRELCAALAACAAVLTNDTGPMHVAAAVGTPVVVPFGSTSPELTGPGWPPGHGHELLGGHAPCAPCFRRTCPIDFRCMTSIGVEAVVEAVLRLLQKRPEYSP